MDIIHASGSVTAADVRRQMPDPPGNATVRSMLRTLEEKGHVKHLKDGRRFVYSATVSPESAKRQSFRHLVDVFFGGSAPNTVAALLNMSRQELSREDLHALGEIIEKAKREQELEQEPEERG